MPIGEHERALAAQWQELNAIYQHVPTILFYVAVEADGEFRFVSMSDSGLAATGLPRHRFVGCLVRDVIPPESRELVLSRYREAVRSGCTVRWREVSEYPAGRRVGEVAVTPLYDARGTATHLVGVVHDITERERLDEVLRERDDRMAFLLRLNDGLRPLNDPVEIQDVAARLLGEHLGVDRVIFATIEGEDFNATTCYSNGAGPFQGRGSIATFGVAVLEAGRRGGRIAVNDFRTDPRFSEAERAAQRARGVAAFAGAGLQKDGEWVALFGVHSATPRVWTENELAVIDATAERMWLAEERILGVRALQEREHRLRLALDASGGGSWTWNARTNETDWDDRFRLQYGFGPDEPPTFEAWMARVLEEDRPLVLRVLNEVLNSDRNEWDSTFRIVRPDGAMSWIQSLGRASRGPAGEVTQLTGLELDITARRRTEEALQARRDEEHTRELRLLLETAAQGVVSVDARGVIVTANRAIETMFGWGPGELIGQSIEQLIPASLGKAHKDHRSSYFAKPHPRLMGGDSLDLAGARRDGSTFPIEVSLNHVQTADGGRAIAFVTDTSERRRAAAAIHDRTVELEYRTAQLSQMASDLTLAEQQAREQLAKTLHDGLQQMLVVSAMHLEQYLSSGTRDSAPASLIVRAKIHLEEAIGAARSLSVELSPPLLQNSGLPAALTWLADWNRRKYGLDVRVTADPQANSSRRDVRTLLFESVRELLFNVVKHAGVEAASVDLSLDGNDMLSIAVTDDGVGFDPIALGERKAAQSGWGLFSIRERLTLLGGRFEIESALGRGTTFRLIAPRGPAQAPGAQESASRVEAASTDAPPADGVSRATSPRALRILIVDDHAAVRRTLRQLLESRREFQVVGEAGNGLEAIGQAHALRPDVVLMDVAMPEMDGVQATHHIRAELPFIQVLGLSMYGRSEGLHAIVQAGAARFFTKGADTQALIDHLAATHLTLLHTVAHLSGSTP